jgi:transposase-like protein
MTEVVSKVICKNCGSEAVVKFGSYKGVQRYWCKVCKRKFKADNALFDMKVSPEYISTALSMYYSGSSISDIRNQLKQEYGYVSGNRLGALVSILGANKDIIERSSESALKLPSIVSLTTLKK